MLLLIITRYTPKHITLPNTIYQGFKIYIFNLQFLKITNITDQ